MSNKCPRCGKTITELVVVRTGHIHFRLDEWGEERQVGSEVYEDPTNCNFECPECEYGILGGSYDNALRFLRGPQKHFHDLEFRQCGREEDEECDQDVNCEDCPKALYIVEEEE